MSVPLNPLPWEEITLVINQPKTGSQIVPTFDAGWKTGGYDLTDAALWGAVGEANTLRARYNPHLDVWNVTDFN